jgi:hypothetical protein
MGPMILDTSRAKAKSISASPAATEIANWRVPHCIAGSQRPEAWVSVNLVSEE